MLTVQSMRKQAELKNRIDRGGSPLCGLVLAGGEGQRLRPFVRRLRGDMLPKQYVKFAGSHSMLDHTYRRAEKLIPPERLFTIVNKAHLDYPDVVAQLSARRQGTVVVQPQNKETGPGLLLPLMYIHKRYPNAVVAVFPSDQFVFEADRLMRHIRLAHVIVTRQPSKLVLLGMTPEYGESEYGYILPNTASDANGWGTYDVKNFVEKPDNSGALDLIARGALWNTMLMVFKVSTMLQWVQELRPDVHCHFERIRAAIGTPLEPAVVRRAYERLDKINMSKDLLEPIAKKYPGGLVVLPVSDVVWSDWGAETRIVDTLRRMGRVARLRAPLGIEGTQPKSNRSPLPRPTGAIDFNL